MMLIWSVAELKSRTGLPATSGRLSGRGGRNQVVLSVFYYYTYNQPIIRNDNTQLI